MTEECSICLEDIVVDTTGRVEMSGCHHTFHLGCIAKWLAKEEHCPNCRNAVSDKEINYARVVDSPQAMQWPFGVQMSARESLELMRQMLRQSGTGDIQATIPRIGQVYIDEFQIQSEIPYIANRINEPINNATDSPDMTNRDIELIMSHLSVPRNVALSSLQQNLGDVVNAILHLSMEAEEVD